jgi:surfeit locus 1 family protein
MSPRARRIVVLFAALAMVALTARLGVWQLDRAEQKLALQAQREARGVQPMIAAAELARTLRDATRQHERRVVLEGRWLAQHAVFLDNRQMDGRPGFFLVMPLEIAPGDAVLVQRGWAPRDVRDRAALPAVPTETGLTRVVGAIAPPPGRTYALGESDGGVLRQNLDLESFGRESGLALRPLSIRQDEGPPEDGLRRHWPAPAADVHKHHGYAFQWFALSSLLTGLYVWFQLLGPWWRGRRRAV